MTKFEGEAIGVRGKKFKSYSAKDRAKDLENYKKTGVHPGVEASQKRARESTINALPDTMVGPERPRTFLELSVGKRVLGRIVVEVFGDVTPLPARVFVNRCRSGSHSTVAGTAVHKVMPLLGIFLGHSGRYHGEVTKLKNLSELRHVEEHTVSISADGTEIAISLGRSLTLDTTHLVVGRLQAGQDTIAAVLALGVNAHDGPRQPVMVTASGVTNCKGDVDEDDSASEQRRNETQEQSAARLIKESRNAQDSVRNALQAALESKTARTATPAALLKAGAHFDVLGSDASDDSSDEDN